MFDITKLALKIPNFLTYEECDKLISEFEKRKDEGYSENGLDYKTNQQKISNYKVVPLNFQTDSFNFIKQKTKLAIDTWINYLEQPQYFFTHLLKNNLKYSHNYRIMKYKTGSEIHPHSDHGSGIYGSISFNLNDDYEGGVFTYFNGKYPIELKKGDALIFPADYFWVHEVTPVTKGTRYSLNSFLQKYPSKVISHSNYLLDLLYKDYLENFPSEELLGPYN